VSLNSSAFWIVHYDAIDAVSYFTMQGWHKAKEMGSARDASFELGCARKMPCEDPTKHAMAIRPDLWAADQRGKFSESLPDGHSWEFNVVTGNGAVSREPFNHFTCASRNQTGRSRTRQSN
jgi:hypothetical protein